MEALFSIMTEIEPTRVYMGCGSGGEGEGVAALPLNNIGCQPFNQGNSNYIGC